MSEAVRMLSTQLTKSHTDEQTCSASSSPTVNYSVRKLFSLAFSLTLLLILCLCDYTLQPWGILRMIIMRRTQHAALEEAHVECEGTPANKRKRNV